MSWIKIEHGLCKNKKTARFAAAMKWNRHQAIGFMVDFWSWAAQSCDDGQLGDITDMEVAFAVGMDNLDGIMKALISSGFVDKETNRIHEWGIHQREFLRSKYKRSPEKFEQISALYPVQGIEQDQICTGHVPEQHRNSTGTGQELSRNKQSSKEAINQDKQSTTKTSLPKPAASVPGFVEFWQAYPRKVGKDKALDAWKKKKPPLDAVLRALAWQIQSDAWRKDSGAYIPHPTTYLNQGRWKDEPIRGGYAPSATKAPSKPLSAIERAMADGSWEKMTPAQREALIP